METKPLLYGLIGFFIGGLLVSIAANTFDRPPADQASSMTMTDMSNSLINKKGDEFDRAFIAGMIEHHEGAVAMAELSAQNAKHDEIKQLSTQIIESQQKEVANMKSWQSAWGYEDYIDGGAEHSKH